MSVTEEPQPTVDWVAAYAMGLAAAHEGPTTEVSRRLADVTADATHLREATERLAAQEVCDDALRERAIALLTAAVDECE